MSCVKLRVLSDGMTQCLPRLFVCRKFVQLCLRVSYLFTQAVQTQLTDKLMVHVSNPKTGNLSSCDNWCYMSLLECGWKLITPKNVKKGGSNTIVKIPKQVG